MHVDLNSEEVRAKWVKHEGTKELTVYCDEFILGSKTNDWASVVDGRPKSFSQQVSENIVDGLEHELLP